MTALPRHRARMLAATLVLLAGAARADVRGTGLTCPAENFDGVTAPALPAGWTFVPATNNGGSNTFVTATSAADSAPNAAFTQVSFDTAGINDVALVSPEFVPDSGAALRFRHRWRMRTTSLTTTTATRYDGGVLEISINGGPYQDIEAAGGAFTEGGYLTGNPNSVRVVASGVPVSPLANRLAWSGSSGGAGTFTDPTFNFLTSTVTLPLAAIGQPTRVRFRSVQAVRVQPVAVQFPEPGWWIDTLSCVTAPPQLHQSFTPDDSAVGTPSTLRLALSYAGGGAQLTADLVNTLPSGLVVAPAANASSNCTGAVVTATSGAGSFALASGATIPAAGCTVQVDVVTAAAGIYVNTLAANALQTTAGNNPNPTTANYQAVQAGVPTYGVSFEEGTGTPTPYPNGANDTTTQNLQGKDGWSTALQNTRVRTVNPATGLQHVRVTPATPDGNGYQVARSKAFPAGTTDYSVARMSVAIQTLANPPTPAPFDVAALDIDEVSNNTAIIIGRVRFAGAITNPPFSTGPLVGLDQAIQVEDAVTGGFIDTGLDWSSSSSYRKVSIVTRRSDSAVLMCLDGNPIHIGTGAAPDVRHVQFAIQRQTGVGTSGGAATNNLYDVDDVQFDNTNANHCGDLPGLTAPTVRKTYPQASVQQNTDLVTTVTLNNWNDAPIALSADFIDLLPAGLTATAVATTCGGSASFAGDRFVLASGATIPARGSCTLTGTLRGTQPGTFVDGILAGDLQTAAGNNFVAPSVSLTVTEVLVPPTVSTLFAPPSVVTGTDSSLRVILNNPNFSGIALTADLVTNLPAGLNISAISTNCGGTATFTTSTLRLATGATIPGNNGVCSVTATVQSPTVGQFQHTVPIGALQTTAGSNASGASGTLTVTSVTTGSVRMVRTVGTDLSPNACGSDKVITVTARSQVNFCYRLTNLSDVTLNFQTINSPTFGSVLRYQNVSLAPGATHQVNDIRTIASDVVDTATWHADNVLASYTTTVDPVGAVFDDISNTGAIFVNNITNSIPFEFPFYGEPQTHLDLIDGGLAFGRANASFNFVNTELPSANPGMALTVLPYWDAWSTTASAGGNLFWQVKGTAPNRRLITQWQNRRFSSLQPLPMTYQAVLSEQTGEITFLYQQVDTGISNPADTLFQYSFGKSATIGLNFDENRAARYSFFPEAPNASPTPVIHNGSSLRFTPTARQRFSTVDSVGVIVVSAAAVVDTSPIVVSVTEGGSATRPLVIGNNGTANLLWQLDPAQTAANHLPALRQSWPSRESLKIAAQTQWPGNLVSAPPRGTGGGNVPAFAYTLSASGFGLVSLDLEQPNVLTPITTYPSSADYDITGLEFAGTDFTKLYTLAYATGAMHSLNSTSGAATFVGIADVNQNTLPEARSDLAFDPVSGKLHAITFNSVPLTMKLYTIDPQTAVATFVTALRGPGATGLINAIGFNSQGQMFGIDIGNDRLIAIDKLTGDSAPIGPLGFNANGDQSLEYDDLTDTMYWIGGAGPTPPIYSVFRVNTETGAASLVGNGDFGPTPTALGTSAVAIARSHPCMLPSQVQWLSLSETAGVVGPTDTDTVLLNFNPNGLATGAYTAQLCLNSNDPRKPRLRVPLSLTINGDRVFGNGFED